MDMFDNITNMVAERAKEHVRSGNVEKANQYIDQLAEMLRAAVAHASTLEEALREDDDDRFRVPE